MKSIEMMHAIGGIDAKYVQEAENYKKKQHRVIYKVLPAAACLVLLLGVGGYELLYQGTSKSGELAEETAISPEFLEREETMVDSASDGDDTSGLAAQENSGLIVNEVESFTAIAYDMQAPDRTVSCTVEQLQDYYGVCIVPESAIAGFGLTEQAPEMEYEVGYDKSGEVVCDNNTICWQSEDGTRVLKISARTTESGIITTFTENDLEKSQVAGTDVTVAHDAGNTAADYYLSIYETNGVTVTVETEGLSEADVQSVLNELLE